MVTAGNASGFELAPPRRFVLPAILLLLSEEPGYGYGLVPRLDEFRFGHVDRPAVYRALAKLEQDGLVEASSESPTTESPATGQARRVYRVTPLGQRVLRVWMGVIKEQHDYLGQVLHRYQATDTTDAVLAEVEGGWASALPSSWSPVSPSSGRRRRLVPVDGPSPPPVAALEHPGRPRSFRLIPDRSVVLIEVRSTVGPLSFGAVGLTGRVQAAIEYGVVAPGSAPSARMEVDVGTLSSGNRFYDAELHRRIEAERFPRATVELQECQPGGMPLQYCLRGEMTFHGVTRPVQGACRVEQTSASQLVVSGEQVFDIRDFAVPSPTVLMLRIYPDVRVRLHVEAEQEEPEQQREEEP